MTDDTARPHNSEAHDALLTIITFAYYNDGGRTTQREFERAVKTIRAALDTARPSLDVEAALWVIARAKGISYGEVVARLQAGSPAQKRDLPETRVSEHDDTGYVLAATATGTERLRERLALVLVKRDGETEIAYGQRVIREVRAVLQAESPAQETTICRCGLARSYHGPPTNLADHEHEPVTATGTERLREAARKTIAAWDDKWIGCAEMQPMVEALRAALQAESPAQDRKSERLREAREALSPYGGHPDFGPRVVANDARPNIVGWEALAKDAIRAYDGLRAALRETLTGILGEAEEYTEYQHGNPVSVIEAIRARARAALEAGSPAQEECLFDPSHQHHSHDDEPPITPATATGTERLPCARHFGSDGTLCSTHNGRFATPSVNRCDRAALEAGDGT